MDHHLQQALQMIRTGQSLLQNFFNQLQRDLPFSLEDLRSVLFAIQILLENAPNDIKLVELSACKSLLMELRMHVDDFTTDAQKKALFIWHMSELTQQLSNFISEAQKLAPLANSINDSNLDEYLGTENLRVPHLIFSRIRKDRSMRKSE